MTSRAHAARPPFVGAAPAMRRQRAAIATTVVSAVVISALLAGRAGDGTPGRLPELAAFVPERASMRPVAVEVPSAPVPPDTRWFDGRPVRPVATLRMRVTAYSPDRRSCGDFADGRTASMHSVFTNAGNLVAADTRLLPFGSLVSIPGYDGGNVVPVLDRGSRIKGHRLDALFATHSLAMEWGVQDLDVIVWAYADEAARGG